MRHHDRRGTIALFLYTLAGMLCAALVVNSLSVPTGFGARSYSAEFSDVGGLASGSEVTVAGVRIGKVTAVHRETSPEGAATAVVDFEIARDRHLSPDARASIRYGDMLGIRYLALDPPTPEASTFASDSDAAAPEGTRIPLTATTGPVDLTALVNGFKPLFEAIRPEEVNALSRTVVAAFQGEQGALDDLVSRLALVSRDVIERRDVYARLSDNLIALNRTIEGRSADVARLVSGLETVSGALAEGDGAELATLVERGDATLTTLTAVFDEIDPDVRATLRDSRGMTDGWVPNTPAFDTALSNAPRFAREVNHTADRGGFLALYMCSFVLDWESGKFPLFGEQNSEVCR